MKPSVPIQAQSVAHGKVQRVVDELAVEEPMEIRVAGHSIVVTMRTPGNDFELAAGFLFTEGVIARREDIRDIEHCANANFNVVQVELDPAAPFDLTTLSRHVFTSSSCGLCGKTTLDQVRAVLPAAIQTEISLPPEDVLCALPEKLRGDQTLFSKTGGVHATGLFDLDGNLLMLREDVGRHNAMDKLVGALLMENRLPAANTLALVSGRASFELIQKAAMAGIPALAAVGAPSSLAVDLARELRVTLIGFLRDHRYNVYVDCSSIVDGV